MPTINAESQLVHVILVESSGDGWTVRSEQIAGEVTFASDRQAEDAAKQLGATLADAGDPAEIRIHLRDGALAGRFICSPIPPYDFPHVRPSGAVSIALKLAS